MEAYHGCMRCMNRRVRLYTSDGKRHEGTIVNVDRNYVYLKQERKGVNTSGYYPYGYGYNYGYDDSILSLSLFTLLAIALI